MSELLPCPFCGHGAKAHEVFEFGGLSYGVSCTNNEYDEQCNTSNLEGAWSTKEKAIIAWNRRKGAIDG